MKNKAVRKRSARLLWTATKVPMSAEGRVIAQRLAAIEKQLAQIDWDDVAEWAREKEREKQRKKTEFELRNQALNLYIDAREKVSQSCTHRMGGTARDETDTAWITEGTGHGYAVIKHTLPHGGTMILCQRCGKEWMPADPNTGAPATEGWEEAIGFFTTNQPSSSGVFHKSADGDVTWETTSVHPARVIYSTGIFELEETDSSVRKADETTAPIKGQGEVSLWRRLFKNTR